MCLYRAVLKFTHTLQISLLFYIINMVNYSFLTYVLCDIYCNHLLTISITYRVMGQILDFVVGVSPNFFNFYKSRKKLRCKLENLFQ